MDEPRKNQIRCVLGMLGSDVHTKGIRTISRMLGDAGIDVVYAGEHLTNEQLIASVRESRPDFVGLSFSTAGYLVYARLFMEAMRAAGLGDVTVILGGLIHPDDRDALREIGIEGIFGPGTTSGDIVEFMNRVVAERTYSK